MTYGACAVSSNSRTISTEENKRKLIIENPSSKAITKIRIDGCVVNDRSPRCDYMFEIGSPPEKIVYLELKGCDVEKAFTQLCATIDRFPAPNGASKECHIVASRVPKSGPKVQTLKVQMLKQKKTHLFVNTIQHKIIA